MNPYALLTRFSVIEAAAAVQDIPAPVKADLPKLQSTINELVRQIQSGELRADTPTVENCGMRNLDGFPIPPTRKWKESTIARADLLAWCEQKGICPPLLVPDLDEDPRERASLLKLTLALCLKACGAPGDRGLAPKIAEYAQQQGISLSEDTIRKYLKELDNLYKKTD